VVYGTAIDSLKESLSLQRCWAVELFTFVIIFTLCSYTIGILLLVGKYIEVGGSPKTTEKQATEINLYVHFHFVKTIFVLAKMVYMHV